MTARLRRVAAVATAVALMLPVAACTGDDGGSDGDASPTTAPTSNGTDQPDGGVLGSGKGLRRYYTQRVDWSDCGGGFECATVLVPLDYDDLTGDSVGLAVNRLPAADGGARIGSLLTNPGGPGASGVDYLSQSVTKFEALNASYDLVGFDPRGVGGSEPLSCLGTAGLDELFASDPDPDTDQEVATTVGLYRGFGQGCAREAPELLPYMSTADVARDLDVIRAVVGDPRLHYFGFSYGTLIGAVFAELFPDRVGAMVLDGPVDPSLSYEQTLLSQAEGFETSLEAYAADCVSSPGCPLGTDLETGLARIRALLEDLDAEPLPTDEPDRPLTEGLAFYGMSYALYSESLWTGLTLALEAAMEDGDGQPLLLLNDLYAHRTDDGYVDNLLEVYNAVSCLDDRGNPTVDDVESAAAEGEQRAPTMGAGAGLDPHGLRRMAGRGGAPAPGHGRRRRRRPHRRRRHDPRPRDAVRAGADACRRPRLRRAAHP